MNYRFIFLIVFGSLLLIGCVGSNTNNSNSSNAGTSVVSDSGVSIIPPANWQSTAISPMDFVSTPPDEFRVRCLDTNDHGDGWPADVVSNGKLDINTIKANISKPVLLPDSSGKLIQDPNRTILYQGPTTVSNFQQLDNYETINTTSNERSYPNNQVKRGDKIEIRTIHVISGQKVCGIIFIALPSNFDSINAQINASLNTLKFNQ